MQCLYNKEGQKDGTTYFLDRYNPTHTHNLDALDRFYFCISIYNNNNSLSTPGLCVLPRTIKERIRK